MTGVKGVMSTLVGPLSYQENSNVESKKEQSELETSQENRLKELSLQLLKH